MQFLYSLYLILLGDRLRAKKPKEIEIVQVSEQMEEPEMQKDIKLGEIELKGGKFLIIKKTNYNGEDRIDFRVWLNSPRYKGPTKQGFVVTMDKVDDFVKIVNEMKNKLK